MPCFLSTIQSPIQAFLRPAVWIPGVNRLHSHREQWVSMSGTAEQLMEELIQAVDKVAEADPKTTYAVKKVDRDKHRIQIYNWTWAEWLDVVEIEFRDGASGGVEAKCYSFSSGFLPTWFPLCFIFNVILFFIPFYDNKFNSTRLERFRVTMGTECRLVHKEPKSPTETTPIMSKDKPSTPPSEPRQTSSDDRYKEPSDSGRYQESAPTDTASPSPPVVSVDTEPPVMQSQEASKSTRSDGSAMESSDESPLAT